MKVKGRNSDGVVGMRPFPRTIARDRKDWKDYTSALARDRKDWKDYTSGLGR